MATSPACPPGAQRFDVRTSSCVDALADLFNAYMAIVAGANHIEVRYNERWVTYGKGNADALVTLYRTLYAQCPSAKAAGLPDLNPALKARRGPPVRGLSVWPRL